jgi:hypothetical protein
MMICLLVGLGSACTSGGSKMVLAFMFMFMFSVC